MLDVDIRSKTESCSHMSIGPLGMEVPSHEFPAAMKTTQPSGRFSASDNGL
jgi:hypothetical protein